MTKSLQIQKKFHNLDGLQIEDITSSEPSIYVS